VETPWSLSSQGSGVLDTLVFHNTSSARSFLNVVAPKSVNRLSERKRYLARVGGSDVASQGTLVASNVKSGRHVLAEERNSVLQKVASAFYTIDGAGNRIGVRRNAQERSTAWTIFTGWRRGDRCIITPKNFVSTLEVRGARAG
jgi:hypothetical protein